MKGAMASGHSGRQPTKAELTGQLTTLAQKRINKERQKLEQERQELEDNGIFLCWGDEIHKATALIVGPAGTPYEHGFYFFDIQIPDNYPMQPPHVDFRTGDGRVRFNPNLYVEGKVCLSILGTWSGPSWTTSCQLRTVLVSIQSLLNEHPIQNEPGHEKECGNNDKAYSEIIRYENINVGVVRMLKQTPPKFRSFRPHMVRIFLKNAEAYLRTLDAYAARDGSSVNAPLWRFPVKYRTKDLRKEIQDLRVALEAESKTTGEEAASSSLASGALASAGAALAAAAGAAGAILGLVSKSADSQDAAAPSAKRARTT